MKGSRKLLIGAVVVIVVAVAYSALKPVSVASMKSVTASPPGSLSNVQARVPVTPAYGSALEDADRARTELATKTGTSSMPTPVVTGEKQMLPTALDPEERAPEKIVPPVPKVVVVPPVTPVTPVQPPRPGQPQQTVMSAQPIPQRPVVDAALLEAMKHVMTEVDKSNAPVAAATTYYGQPNVANGTVNGASQSQGTQQAVQGYPIAGNVQAASSNTGSTIGTSQLSRRFRVPAAGTILYSRLIGKVNSDTPGPVVAEILQGPYTGARLLGTFQTSEAGVVIAFKTMTVAFQEDGEDKSEVVPISGVAVDSANLGTNMATDVDRHLLEKIGFGFATAFLQGFGQAIGQSGSTVTSGLGNVTQQNPTLNTRGELFVAGGAAAGNAGQIFQQAYGNRKTTITVDADTPFGLLFLGSANGN